MTGDLLEGATDEMVTWLWICLGGAAGTGARYLVSGWALAAIGSAFPYGTLAVNVLGSLLLGGLMHLGLSTDWMSPTVRLALTTGFTGGFTTYSTFSYETLRMMQERAWGLALLNVASTLFVCLAATFLGLVLARWLVGG